MVAADTLQTPTEHFPSSYGPDIAPIDSPHLLVSQQSAGFFRFGLFLGWKSSLLLIIFAVTSNINPMPYGIILWADCGDEGIFVVPSCLQPRDWNYSQQTYRCCRLDWLLSRAAARAPSRKFELRRHDHWHHNHNIQRLSIGARGDCRWDKLDKVQFTVRMLLVLSLLLMSWD